MKFIKLQQMFARFINSRAFKHHFRRSSVVNQSKKTLNHAYQQYLLKMARLINTELLKELGSNREGLTEKQAQRKRQQFGDNQIVSENPLHWRQHLWLCYRNPFNLLLTGLALISVTTGDVEGACVISCMIIISTLLRFFQESKSGQAADKLKEMVINTATVLRPTSAKNGQQEAGDIASARELPMRDLVPGDLILLSAGDMVPADLRLLSAKDLFISQAVLTGETLPVEKQQKQTQPHCENPLDLDNLCFMGTNVISGSATALVLATGSNTYFGTLASQVSRAPEEPTAFQDSINRISWLLIRFMLVMTPLVFLINGIGKHDWLQAALFAVSVAVGLTPEMLPMIVTATLARGAVLLSKRKVIVKRLDAIQNFGAMDILCTDKTGTLTQDRIVLERHTDITGRKCDQVLKLAYLNSYYQTGLKNLLDLAVLAHTEFREDMIIEGRQKIDEIPFDFMRRRMSVVVTDKKAPLLICKGALEEILAVCRFVKKNDEVQPLDEPTLSTIKKLTAALNSEGLRVVAVATKRLAEHQQQVAVQDETELTLEGYIAFLDPPKETTAKALQALREKGVRPLILTGDNALVTQKVCKEVNLKIEGVLLGTEVEKLNDQTLALACQKHNIFAKLNPSQKERIVRVLRTQGHVVGFLGDGINDAPALRAADIGISVNSAIDIAKEAADLILLEKSLLVLERGILEGRKTYSNMLKYMRVTASSNFGNVFSVLIASLFLPFLPMLPTQLLIQNLLYDISQIAIPLDKVDPQTLSKPCTWQTGSLTRFMFLFGPLSSLFDMLTFALLWYGFGANSPGRQPLFHSGWFVEGLISQLLIFHVIRTQQIPFFKSPAALSLLFMTAIIALIGIYLPQGRLSSFLHFVWLPIPYFAIITLVILLYLGVAEALKRFLVKKFGWY